jgi:hypothetical protein
MDFSRVRTCDGCSSSCGCCAGAGGGGGGAGGGGGGGGGGALGSAASCGKLPPAGMSATLPSCEAERGEAVAGWARGYCWCPDATTRTRASIPAARRSPELRSTHGVPGASAGRAVPDTSLKAAKAALNAALSLAVSASTAFAAASARAASVGASPAAESNQEISSRERLRWSRAAHWISQTQYRDHEGSIG